MKWFKVFYIDIKFKLNFQIIYVLIQIYYNNYGNNKTSRNAIVSGTKDYNYANTKDKNYDEKDFLIKDDYLDCIELNFKYEYFDNFSHFFIIK